MWSAATSWSVSASRTFIDGKDQVSGSAPALGTTQVRVSP